MILCGNIIIPEDPSFLNYFRLFQWSRTFALSQLSDNWDGANVPLSHLVKMASRLSAIIDGILK